jgi:hypothetical protein
MLEFSRRRPGFVPTVAIELADGQTWWFPGPDPRPEDPGYEAVVRSVLEAEDAPERSMAELVLAILLLSCNYELSAAEFQELLIFAPDDPALLGVRAAFSALATDHAGHVSPAESPGGLPARGERESNGTVVQPFGEGNSKLDGSSQGTGWGGRRRDFRLSDPGWS